MFTNRHHIIIKNMFQVVAMKLLTVITDLLKNVQLFSK